MKIEMVLNQLVQVFKNTLHQQLEGVYLHGSLAMNGFHRLKSDIDLLVVVNQKLDEPVMAKIIEGLISLESSLPPRGVEMSIVTTKTVQCFTYPTPFELHYSNKYREQYRKEGVLCKNGLDPDLAAHIFVTYHRGKTLYGKPVKHVIKPIEERYYLESILHDVEDARANIQVNPVYYTLNLCRVLYYLKERVVSSKKEAGEWALQKLPSPYLPLVTYSINHYSGQTEPDSPGRKILLEFADYMLKAIEQYKTMIE